MNTTRAYFQIWVLCCAVPAAQALTVLPGGTEDAVIDLAAAGPVVASVPVEAGQTMVATVVDSDELAGFAPTLTVRKPGGGVVTTGGGESLVALEFEAATSGDFSLEVGNGAAGASGNANFRLRVASVAGPYDPDSQEHDSVMLPSRFYVGSIELGDLDVWSFDAVEGEQVTLYAAEIEDNGGFELWLRIADPAGNVVWNSKYASGPAEFTAERSGLYRILITDRGVFETPGSGTGTYYLLLNGATALPLQPSLQAGAVGGGSLRLSWEKPSVAWELAQSDEPHGAVWTPSPGTIDEGLNYANEQSILWDRQYYRLILKENYADAYAPSTISELPPQPGPAYTGSITLAEAATTSAGIYDSSGRLRRTLWSGREYPAQTIAVSWDGRDDFGTLCEAGDYTLKVLTQNVDYVWEGTLGNTSSVVAGVGKHRSFYMLYDIEFDAAGKGLLTCGYNEGQHALATLTQTDYQRRTNVAKPDFRRVFTLAAADADTYYVVNIGNTAAEPVQFITSFSSANPETDGKGFTAGVTIDGGNSDRRWKNVILLADPADEVNPTDPVEPMGIAVEQNGNRLFVSLNALNEVAIFDKVTGVRTGTIPVSDPRSLAVDALGNLWVADDEFITKFDSEGTELSKITDTFRPLDITIDPIDGDLLVVDGRGRMQIRRYDTNGGLAGTYGDPGGNEFQGPEVNNRRFQMKDFFEERSFISVSPNGNIWIGDLGNARVLIVDQNFTYVDQIAYLQRPYMVTVANSDPTRLFAGWLEYAIDYSKPLAEGWSLARNWTGEVWDIRDELSAGLSTGIADVVTFTSEGVSRTFAAARGPDSTAAWNTFEFVDGNTALRRTNNPKRPSDQTMHADGIRRVDRDDPNFKSVWLQPFEGFDANGDPIFGEEVILARGPKSRTPAGGAGFSSRIVRYPSTDSGKVIFFAGATTGENYRGMHLGIVPEGGAEWQWMTNPSALWQVKTPVVVNGILQNPDEVGQVIGPLGTFHVGGTTTYAGSLAVTSGEHIVCGFHGEFFRGVDATGEPAALDSGQANQFLHWHESGLFVGQFGTSLYPWRNRTESLAGAAGNAFSPVLVEVDGRLFLYHNDESAHSGIHRWEIQGLDSIEILTAPMVAQ